MCKLAFIEIEYNQGDLHLPGPDTDQKQCAMEWPTTLLHQHLVKKFEIH
jgi:hypothetical protein